ncbi:u23-Nephitoxin-Nsp1f_1 [Trichonephila clavata]|uniref:U23-Nephitoxin-Nsp1f_1 n=1 Tax=Trichonephila clavata TaxID=2740835 RepID=A0A8X6HUA0_TRICU|nr:u23-Nephitoxin-Nsp1f_1 [Trichonephila clavata]
MMKLVVLLVLIAMTTPAFAQSFQEVLQMFMNLGCKDTKDIGAASRFFVRTCDKCLSFSVTLQKADQINCGMLELFYDVGDSRTNHVWNPVNISSNDSQMSGMRVKLRNVFLKSHRKQVNREKK